MFTPFPYFRNFTFGTPVVPNLYWDAYDHEERIKKLCCEFSNMITYDDKLADAINETIDFINKVKTPTEVMTRKILVIGDSFSLDVYSDTPLWYTYIEKQLGATATVKAEDGAGFSVAATSGNTFLDLANAAFEESTDYDYIFVVGGINDIRASQTTATITTAINNFVAKCKEKCPNAFLNLTLFAGSAYHLYSQTGYNELEIVRGVINSIDTDGCRVQNAATWFLCFDTYTRATSKLDSTSEDKLHPTTAGQKYLANCIQDTAYPMDRIKLVPTAEFNDAGVNFVEIDYTTTQVFKEGDELFGSFDFNITSTSASDDVYIKLPRNIDVLNTRGFIVTTGAKVIGTASILGDKITIVRFEGETGTVHNNCRFNFRVEII